MTTIKVLPLQNRYASLLARRALAVANSMLGARELTGKNDGAIPARVTAFVFGVAEKVAWCACFATYCVYKGAENLADPRPKMPKFASSSLLYKWAVRNDRLLSYPVPGCIGLVKGGPTGHSHTFLVDDVESWTSGNSVMKGTWNPNVRVPGPNDYVVGIDGNYKNAVGNSRRKISACDFVEIC